MYNQLNTFCFTTESSPAFLSIFIAVLFWAFEGLQTRMCRQPTQEQFVASRLDETLERWKILATSELKRLEHVRGGWSFLFSHFSARHRECAGPGHDAQRMQRIIIVYLQQL